MRACSARPGSRPTARLPRRRPGASHAETSPPSASAAPISSNDQTLVGTLVAPMFVRLSPSVLREQSRQPYPRPRQAAPISAARPRRMECRADHVERSDASLYAAADPRAALARQRRPVAAMISRHPLSTLFQPITSLPAGTVVLMFGGAAELVAVDDHPCAKFPGATLLTIKPVSGGDEFAVLVPHGYCPLALP